MKKLVLILSLFLTSTALFSQTKRCSSVESLQERQEKDPSLLIRQALSEKRLAEAMKATQAENRKYLRISTDSLTPTIEIPVVVHVLYHEQKENISDAQIRSQIEVLNEDFNRQNADSALTPPPFKALAGKLNIVFKLATVDPNNNYTSGIIRKYTHVAAFIDNDSMKFSSNGGDNAWDANKYLNIWTCNLGGNLLGYAHYPYEMEVSPETDGVVIGHQYFGRIGTVSTPFEKGRTTTHEVGHWLNLYHVWGDNNCGNDSISDTPVQSTSNLGCPVFPHITCNNGPDGDMFSNFMDYSDDACMNIFTKKQAERMNVVLNLERANLVSNAHKFTVNAPKQAFSVKVYPNPTYGKLNISSPGSTLSVTDVSVYNILGELIFSDQIPASTDLSSPYVIDLNTKANGVYFTKIKSEEITQTVKVILSR